MASQIILFSQPRSGSHLLERLLTSQPNVELLAHPFSASRGKQVPWLLRDDYADGMGAEELREYREQMLKEIENWEDALRSNSEADKSVLFVHSHPFFPVLPDTILAYMQSLASPEPIQLRKENFTLVPDCLLLRPGTIPLISIRDPRLTVPSTYRVLERMNLPNGGSRAFFLETTCNIWNCVLYNYYESHGIDAIIVDADDYMTDETFVRRLASKLGLDPAKVTFEWDAVTDEQKQTEIHPMLYASQNTLYESSGVLAGRAAKNCNFAGMAENWKEEFGDDAGMIEEMVGVAEPHYRYLYERRWRGD